MSAFIIPALALGGAYLLYNGITKKNKHKHHDSSSSNSSSTSSTKKHRSATISSSSSSSSSSSNKKEKSKKSIFSSLLKLNKNKTKKEKQEKDKKEKQEKSKTLYVYYTYGSNKNKKWHYKNLPGGWNLKNKSDINSSKIKYTKLNSFSGPKRNKDAIRRYLEKAFEYLKKQNIVKYYKITSDKLV
jgi:hypothetical protein